MSLINRLLQRISGQSRHYRARRHTAYSPFGIQAAQVQVLESRRLLSALTVTTAADSGAGSLRAEIAAANSGDSINFASSLNGQTITLTSGLLSINKGLTIHGPGAGQLTISGGNASAVFGVASSQPVVLTGLTVSNGWGGGIYNGSNLTVSACTISNCHAFASVSDGGGIYNRGTLTLSDCTISGDSAAVYGGGIYNTGKLTASGCTVSGDSARFMGGGIYVGGAGQAWLTNCTIAENFANGTSVYSNTGGGLCLAGLSATLTNCTVSLNQARGLGGGIDVPPFSFNIILTNTIVAGNTDSAGSGYSEQPFGADISARAGLSGWGGHNLIGNGFGCHIANGAAGNIVGSPSHVINAMLGPLQDNGGPTQTMALLAGSPAIGQVDNASAPATDQRGVTRRDLAGELTDIGAFEL
jgi:hypothetical protein